MARRRVRTVGAVLVNPRKRRRSNPKRRRTAAKRRTYSRKRSNPKRRRRRSSAKRRNPARRRRRSTARRRTSSRRRTNPRRRRRSSAKRRSTARRRTRRNPYVLTSNPRRRRRKAPKARRRSIRRTRRNPGIVAGLQSMFAKIPVIGGPLSVAAGVLPYAAVGAPLGVELPMQAAAAVAKWEQAPEFLKMSEPWWFWIAGLGSATLAHYALKMAGFDKATCEKAAIAVGSAAFGAGYYTMRYGQKVGATPAEAASGQAGVQGLGAVVLGAPYILGQGMGAVEIGQQPYGAVAIGGYGMGPAYTVGPQGYGSPMGAVMVGG